MKKSIIIIIIAALTVGAGITYLIAIKPQNSSTTTSTDAAASTVSACDILTPAIAKQFIGSNVTQPGGSAGDTAIPDMRVSNCLYISSSADVAKMSSVNVLVRAAKTQDGINANKAQFTSLPSGAQSVSGLADKAYYDPTFRQLNVLKGGNWYIVTAYTGSPTNATLATDQKLAKQLRFQ